MIEHSTITEMLRRLLSGCYSFNHQIHERHLNICALLLSSPQHLQKLDSTYSPESCVYYCTLCDYSTKARLNLVQHARSPRHHQNEGLRKLQLHQQGLGGDEDGLSLHEVFSVKECHSSQGLFFFNLLCVFA